jgi:hypothetical protein
MEFSELGTGLAVEGSTSWVLGSLAPLSADLALCSIVLCVSSSSHNMSGLPVVKETTQDEEA